MSPWEACFYAGSPMTDLSQTDCENEYASTALGITSRSRSVLWIGAEGMHGRACRSVLNYGLSIPPIGAS
jgi:hypothetical protein